MLRAHRAHAGILGLDAGGARNRPGVRLVLTGREFADSGWKSLPGGVAYEGIGGQKMRKPFWPALARDRVHYAGQPLALVVADSAAIAQDASEHISIEYDELAPVIGFSEATRAGAPQLHHGRRAASPSNALGERAIYDGETGQYRGGFLDIHAARRLDAGHPLRRHSVPTKTNALGAGASANRELRALCPP